MDETTTKLVTPDLLESLRTPRGGWRRVDLQAIGVPFPNGQLVKGWKQRIIGQPIKPAPNAQPFLPGIA